MSRFYASIQGNKGMATRQGTAKSGIQAHIRGWAIGVSVDCRIDENGEDIAIIHLTSGSNGCKGAKHLGTFKAFDLD